MDSFAPSSFEALRLSLEEPLFRPPQLRNRTRSRAKQAPDRARSAIDSIRNPLSIFSVRSVAEASYIYKRSLTYGLRLAGVSAGPSGFWASAGLLMALPFLALIRLLSVTVLQDCKRSKSMKETTQAKARSWSSVLETIWAMSTSLAASALPP